jgi:thiamine biosynthesis lipoprotein
MGTDAHVIVVGGPAGLADVARSRVDELDARWSRFRPDSELSQLNASAGTPFEVSPETLLLAELALEGWDLSGGAFDATMLGALIEAGYDRDFDELVVLPAEFAASVDRDSVDRDSVDRDSVDRDSVDRDSAYRSGRYAPVPTAVPVFAGYDSPPVEIHGGTVCLRDGVGIDSGGIGKGLAADLVVAELLARGAEGACVNLGGDLRVAGVSPEGDGWTIGIDHPWALAPLALVGVAAGAVATSTTLRRRWLVGDEWRHHLIDPRSGLPSDSDLNHVTVIAGEGWVAEVLAKAVLLNGSEFAFNILGGTGAEALAVDEQGRITATDGFATYLGDAGMPAWLPVPDARAERSGGAALAAAV